MPAVELWDDGSSAEKEPIHDDFSQISFLMRNEGSIKSILFSNLRQLAARCHIKESISGSILASLLSRFPRTLVGLWPDSKRLCPFMSRAFPVYVRRLSAAGQPPRNAADRHEVPRVLSQTIDVEFFIK